MSLGTQVVTAVTANHCSEFSLRYVLMGASAGYSGNQRFAQPVSAPVRVDAGLRGAWKLPAVLARTLPRLRHGQRERSSRQGWGARGAGGGSRELAFSSPNTDRRYFSNPHGHPAIRVVSLRPVSEVTAAHSSAPVLPDLGRFALQACGTLPSPLSVCEPHTVAPTRRRLCPRAAFLLLIRSRGPNQHRSGHNVRAPQRDLARRATGRRQGPSAAAPLPPIVLSPVPQGSLCRTCHTP